MTEAISTVLIDLAAEWGVHELEGMTDAQLEVVAVRLMVETQDRPTSRYLRKIAREVKASADPSDGEPADMDRAGGQATDITRSQEPAPASSAPRKPVFLATERTTRARLDREAERRLDMARAHDRESKRTGLYIVPKRPEKLGPLDAHRACVIANEEGTQPCFRCAPLLHPATCDCAACDEWWGMQA